MLQAVQTLFEESYTDCLVTIKNDFIFSSIFTTNMQKALNTTENWDQTHIYHQQIVGDAQPYFPQRILLWLCLVVLKAYQGKQRVGTDIALLLALLVSCGEGAWKAIAPLHFNRVMPIPTQSSLTIQIRTYLKRHRHFQFMAMKLPTNGYFYQQAKSSTNRTIATM